MRVPEKGRTGVRERTNRSHDLPALSRVWQHVKLSDVGLRSRTRYSLIVDEDVLKPTNQPNKPNHLTMSFLDVRVPPYTYRVPFFDAFLLFICCLPVYAVGPAVLFHFGVSVYYIISFIHCSCLDFFAWRGRGSSVGRARDSW